MDIANYTHTGAHLPNCDVLRTALEENCFVVLCDGANGMRGGDKAAEVAADMLLLKLQEGCLPDDAILEAQAALRLLCSEKAEMKNARSTAVALAIGENDCKWASVGDSRAYHFRGGEIAHKSIDDSAAYKEYAAGKISYEAIRMSPMRSTLTAALGEDAPQLDIHAESFGLQSGDALLVCSDGFWQYVYETEMLVDLTKAKSAEEWLSFLLLRLLSRSMMDGDNLTAWAAVV